MNAEAFQAAALTWITALSIVLTAVVAAIAKLWPLIQGFGDASRRLDDHSRRITANSQKTTDIALAISPETEPQPQVVGPVKK